jgi:hypothetical protein
MAAASSARAPVAAFVAMLFAVPPVTQPPQVKPTISMATTLAAHAQKSKVFDSLEILEASSNARIVCHDLPFAPAIQSGRPHVRRSRLGPRER